MSQLLKMWIESNSLLLMYAFPRAIKSIITETRVKSKHILTGCDISTRPETLTLKTLDGVAAIVITYPTKILHRSDTPVHENNSINNFILRNINLVVYPRKGVYLRSYAVFFTE